MRQRILVAAVLVMALATVSAGQTVVPSSPAGKWQALFHEDWPHRWPGPEIGDYTGLPITDAARFRAESWNASLLTVPEHQLMPHPSSYAMRGPANISISEIFDRGRERLIAYEVYGTYGRATRTIWLDGRAHPPAYAAHTWAGFSTGVWQGRALMVTTTHLKNGWIQRNGVFHTDQATMVEFFVRHGAHLTVVGIVDDAAILTEPFIRSSNWALDPDLEIPPSNWNPSQAVVEVVRPKGEVPHYLPGTNTVLGEFSARHGVPPEAARGGAHTMYPEYRRRLDEIGVPVLERADPILLEWWEQWRDACNCGTGGSR